MYIKETLQCLGQATKFHFTIGFRGIYVYLKRETLWYHCLWNFLKVTVGTHVLTTEYCSTNATAGNQTGSEWKPLLNDKFAGANRNQPEIYNFWKPNTTSSFEFTMQRERASLILFDKKKI